MLDGGIDLELLLWFVIRQFSGDLVVGAFCLVLNFTFWCLVLLVLNCSVNLVVWWLCV